MIRQILNNNFFMKAMRLSPNVGQFSGEFKAENINCFYIKTIQKWQRKRSPLVSADRSVPV